MFRRPGSAGRRCSSLSTARHQLECALTNRPTQTYPTQLIVTNRAVEVSKPYLLV